MHAIRLRYSFWQTTYTPSARAITNAKLRRGKIEPLGVADDSLLLRMLLGLQRRQATAALAAQARHRGRQIGARCEAPPPLDSWDFGRRIPPRESGLPPR